jgi:dienelactone hydrolase
MRPILLALLLLAARASTIAAPLTNETLQSYFRARVDHLASNCLTTFDSLQQWEAVRPKYRAQLFEMLSLSPLPEKTDLHPVVTGKVERDGVIVEKIQFQSMPQLYVTANLYLPSKIEKPLPAILYVCGHGPVKTDGISYGNKVAYQHHGVWFARNGYACLIIDTIQLGEIEGIHHGTYREGMWWWNSRGYTSAGVEAWNGIRALDYLETRPEIDKSRFGVSGRSGGGAYSWWITALDERVKVSAPVAGITDLQNYVVDGVIEGHCDCMFFVNTYGWDYPMVAALAAPRPLMIGNSDRDMIFPLDGVERLHKKVSHIYDLYKKPENLALVITPGPHKDTQELQVPVFRWFNHHLKGDDSPVEMAAKPLFTGQELKVFDKLPSDERTSKIHVSFVPVASVSSPKSATEWEAHRRDVLVQLKDRVFAGWPDKPCDLQPVRKKLPADSDGKERQLGFQSEENVSLRMVLLGTRKPETKAMRVLVLDADDYPATSQGQQPVEGELLALLFTRGRETSNPNDKTAIQIRRRYMLVGQTLDSMRVWDILRGLNLLATLPETSNLKITATGTGNNAINLLYASLFTTQPLKLELNNLPDSQMSGPDYLNILRFIDLPEAIALSLQSHELKLQNTSQSVGSFANDLAGQFHWPNRVQSD